MNSQMKIFMIEIMLLFKSYIKVQNKKVQTVFNFSIMKPALVLIYHYAENIVVSKLSLIVSSYVHLIV